MIKNFSLPSLQTFQKPQEVDQNHSKKLLQRIVTSRLPSPNDFAVTIKTKRKLSMKRFEMTPTFSQRLQETISKSPYRPQFRRDIGLTELILSPRGQ